MKNRAFEEAFSDVRLSDTARERIIGAAIDKAPAARRRVLRPMRVALAAVLALSLLTCTALAVSPELRDMLWGDFSGEAQNYSPDESAAQVYDGVEARISSALTDGYIMRLHVEFRDTEGDRLREIYEKNKELHQEFPAMGINVEGPEGASGPMAPYDMAMICVPKIIAFDGETGILTLEFFQQTMNPPEGMNKISLDIPTGFLGTKAVTEEVPAPEGMYLYTDDDGYVTDTARPVETMTSVKIGWRLTAPVETLTVRHSGTGPLEAHVSDIGLTVYAEMGKAPAGWNSDMTVTLSNGTALTFGNGGLAGTMSGGIADRLLTTVEFAAPVDVSNVASVTVGGEEIAFE